MRTETKTALNMFIGAADCKIIVSYALTGSAAFSEALWIACLPARAGSITPPYVMRVSGSFPENYG